jgi:hypothetical protein
MRYNEMQCVCAGVDPYDLCFGAPDSTGFVELQNLDIVPAQRLLSKNGKAVVNSYPPWAYTLLFPLRPVPPELANLLFNALALGCHCFLLFVAFWRARDARLSPARTRIVVAAGGFLGLPLLRVLQVGNYGLLLAVAAAVLALLLEREHDWLGGIPLAILLIKPHLGLPFAVPLLVKGKWKTLLAAGLLCLAASVPPALLTGRNVIAMILHAARSGTASIHSAWQSTGWFSPPVFNALATRLGGTGGALAASMALGALVLFAASWRIRREESWWLQMVPPAVVACLWSMGHAHDHVLLSSAVATVAIAAAVRRGQEKFFTVGTVLLAAEFWLFAALAGVAGTRALLSAGSLGLSNGLEATRSTGPRVAYTAYLQFIAVLQTVWVLSIPRRPPVVTAD